MPATVIADGSLSVERTVELNAAPETVWKMIGGYNDLDVWHPAVANSQLTGSGHAPGDLRVLTLGDGATITERLVSYDANRYRYAIEASPLPVDHYVSTLAVTPRDGGGTIVTWNSSFDAKGVPDAEATKAIAGIYEAGLQRLAGYFNGK
jgi:mxaD protein